MNDEEFLKFVSGEAAKKVVDYFDQPDPSSIMFWHGDHQPAVFVGRSWFKRKADVDLAVSILRAGRPGEACAGYAYCRICNVELGSKDLSGFGLKWPEACEHYVTDHDVWTPGLDRLLEAWHASPARLLRRAR